MSPKQDDKLEINDTESDTTRNHLSSNSIYFDADYIGKKTFKSKKEKCTEPYMKKPLNAFMFFMKENRATVVSELNSNENKRYSISVINKILGQKWNELNYKCKTKYFDMSREAHIKHMEMYPNWSARSNYGRFKKKKNKMSKKDEYKCYIKIDMLEERGKCRAHYGVHQKKTMWCNQCRLKKKCIRFDLKNKATPSDMHKLQLSEDSLDINNENKDEYFN